MAKCSMLAEKGPNSHRNHKLQRTLTSLDLNQGTFLAHLLHHNLTADRVSSQDSLSRSPQAETCKINNSKEMGQFSTWPQSKQRE